MCAKRRCRALLLLLVCLCSGSPPAAFAGNVNYQERWYRASVNHLDTRTTILLLYVNGAEYVRRLDIRLLDLPIPKAKPLFYKSELYYPVSAWHHVNLYVDKTRQKAFFIDSHRPNPAPPPGDNLLLTITVNGSRIDQPQYVQYIDGQLVLPTDTLKALRVKSPASWIRPVKTPLPLSALAGEYYSVDYRQLALEVTVPPRLLQTSTFRIGHWPTKAETITRSQHSLSAVFDYDIARGHLSGDGYWSSGLYSAAFGGRTAACGTGYLNPPDRGAWRRLDTTCNFDLPDKMTSISVGDSISDGSTVTQPVRFGGVRIGTDFGLQPEFITLPDSRIAGTARVPSTLEVWMNQMLLLRTDVPSGPFEVNDIPLQTGAGQLQVTLISPTGARRVVSSPFYADSALLAPGLSDWSINFGKLRENFSTSASHYTDSFAAASIRHGVTGAFTGELGLQTTSDFRLADAGAAFQLDDFAAMNASVAYSAGKQGQHGSAVSARITHLGRHFTISYQWQHHSAGYQELAYPQPGTAPKNDNQLGIGFPLGSGWSLNAAEFHREYYNGTSLRFQSAALGVRLGNVGFLQLSAVHLGSGQSPWMYAAQLTIPFGARSNATAWSQTDGSTLDRQFGLQMNPPAGPGYGYRVDVGRDGLARTALAALALKGSLAQLDLEGRRFGDLSATTARLSGSMLVSADGIGLARREPGSYAVVRVGAPDVPVYHDGQLSAYSGADGNAIIDGLRPYDSNHITIRPQDVPLNIQPQKLEMTLVPGRRQVMDVDFDFKLLHYLTGELHTATGMFVPAGATLHVAGREKTSVVGSQGRFFFSAPASGRLDVKASWGTHVCGAVMQPSAAPTMGTVQELGAITCQEEPQ